MELYLLRHGDAAEPGMKKMNEINEDYSRRKEILLVGHEPADLSLPSVLISGRHGVSLKLKKGGPCKLSADSLRFGKCATLEWLMGPSQIID
ncbi:MAG: hypothetical protein M1339_04140 [Bacteroidetes bacterium]|nr:hypothetical protein [Bacteroidota bacterium]